MHCRCGSMSSFYHFNTSGGRGREAEQAREAREGARHDGKVRDGARDVGPGSMHWPAWFVEERYSCTCI